MAEQRDEDPAMRPQPLADEDDVCPVKQVEVTVPKTDDPNMPVLTFRMWVLGLGACVVLSFVNQFFWYRTEPLTVSSISAQIAVVPLGHLMARTITDRVFFQGTRWQFTMNPGPFNIKEHVLITIFANSGAGTVYATHILSAVKLLYKRKLTFLPAFIVMITTQVLGFGWAGIFRKYLVEPGEMWWPSNLVQVSLFRALHETEKRPKGATTRTQFFLLVLASSFSYYIFPGFIFKMLTSFSWICWLAPKSILVQQLGSGFQGLGIGAIGFDWATISSYLGSPLASPWFATANVAVGFCLVMYVMTPLSYWFNVYNAKNFPIYSNQLFTFNGSVYNTSAIIDTNFKLDKGAYAEAGQLHISTFFAMTYGIGFATLSATVVHVLLFHGRDMWAQSKRAFEENKKPDVHTRLMVVYKKVPMWWFWVILVVNIAVIIFACEYYNDSLQLPWWGVLLACAIAISFTLPIGIITATTNQQPGLNIITEYIIGYMYPGRPVANMCFKVYGYISMVQALTFLQDFKLGHYMKIPPRAMFMAQVVGTLVSVLVYQLTAWWLMGTIPDLCSPNLPADSLWTCPMDTVFYDASVIWGLVGPRRIFGNLGVYTNVSWFFLGGAIGPLLVYLAHRAFPKKNWIQLIHLPVLLGATANMPPASAVNYTSWLVVAFVSGFVFFRYRPKVWERYNYVLSGGLDAGTAFMTVLIFVSLQTRKTEIKLNWWGNELDGCPLASCPTAKGVNPADAGECPIKEVEVTVSKSDDPRLPVVTFRMWVLGVTSCVFLAFVNQFFWYRTQPLGISSICAQVAVVPIGRFMARTLTDRVFFKGSRWQFTMNPGPFNVKEHVLITIFANSGAGSVYATHILSAVKLLYKRKLDFFPAFILMLTTQDFIRLLLFMAEITEERPAMEIEQQHPPQQVVDPDVCSIKQVDVTVSKTDDPSLPVLTFRMWVLGLTSCVFLSFVNQFFWYRTQPLMITGICAQVAVVPIGRFMEKTITDRVFLKGSRWEFTLNPGPFNVKEHVLITIFANAGAGTVYATHVLTAVKLLYRRKLEFFPAFLVMITTQVLGFGWAGIFRKHLVEPAEMWWPGNLVQVSLFRALHEKDKRPKGGMSRTQFFLIALVFSFCYYIFSGFLFQMLATLSWICWLAPKSVLIQQLGSGSSGLGLGSFGIDWPTMSSYLGSPLVSPWHATANVAVGFVIVMYLMTPLSYWFNVYNAKNFPIFSNELFKLDGSVYNITSIINSNFQLDHDAYVKAGPVNMSTFFAMTYGFGFATLSATLVHVLLFNGSDMWKQTRKAFGEGRKPDIHTRLMKAYKQVPMWWFLVILVVNIVVIIFACEYYNDSLQLPWWGVLLACAIAISFTLPIGIIVATTNQAPGLNIVTEYIIGYIYPGRPVANMCFKVYGYISMTQALTFLQDFKLGHYMKIPPRAMFMAQVLGTVLSVIVYQITAWWLMGTIPNLCDITVLPPDSQWKCPMDRVFFDASVIWGLIGPRRMFGDLGRYSAVNWFFLGGAIAPAVVWYLSRKVFPKQKWIGKIHMPVLIGSTAMMPPASAVNYNTWILVAFFSGFVVFRYRPRWWERYNYVLSAGLDAGTAFVTILIFIALGSRGIGVDWWGNVPDGCPLASCPTAKGILKEGCPAYQ
ncbi:hypothetical protein RJ639_046887 [Escallonia herrerae]|uniref:Uncharacterized protein n=1 Tax=Escallonia herrerae TaxID=1293975 RepID=A0AA89B0L7_9ASTE|nr:hypothetical protein RJ639_046887 [Escallonia herrerae]